ncbi:MAG: sensor histidine kinase [Chloroflexota bacterium]
MFPVLRNARLKLTLIYTAGISVIMALFSVVLYVALQGALAGNLEASGNAGLQVQQALLDAELTRARLVLIAVNVAGWLLFAAAAYLISGRTLRPVEETVERQRQFTAHASHELRTPLTVMRGEIDVTLSRERRLDEYQRILRLVGAEVDRMSAMVADLLTLAQVESMPGAGRVEVQNVAQAIGITLEAFSTALAEKNIEARNCVPQSLEAGLDWARVDNLVRNLVDNAIRHTPFGGEIRVNAMTLGHDLEISVFNTGSTLAGEDLPYLFMPFYRGKNSTPGSGVGLGLALCQKIAESLGGSILARNLPEGVSFAVHLPKSHAHLTGG